MKQRFTLMVLVLFGAALVFSADAQERESAAEAYAALNLELESMGRELSERSTTEYKRDQIIKDFETKLLAFRDKYSGTPEAFDAAFQLGVIKHQVGEHDVAARYLSEFIVLGKDAEREKIAIAHYFLAEAYKGAGKIDDAQVEYQTIINDFAQVNPRLTQAVKTAIAGLESERRLAIGGEPIDFSVRGTRGETISPAGYKGKVLLIDFWATWCKPCMAEMPNVKRVYDKYNDQGFEIVGISLDRQSGVVDNYIKTNKIGWPQYVNGNAGQLDVASKYGVQLIPATFLIDREGKIRYKSLRGRHLETAVAQLLEE